MAQTESTNRPKTFKVQTPDGGAITGYEWGNPTGPEIVFVHGFSQSHLSWRRQFESELANSFRLTAYDFRGHGAKDRVALAAMVRYTAGVVIHAQTSIYQGAGHMMFWEEAGRFNRELAAFATRRQLR